MRQQPEVRPTTPWAIREIAKNLRDADKRELHATRGDDAHIVTVLFDCVEQSDWTQVGYIGDTPVCIHGVARGRHDGHGHPWMMGTEGIESRPKSYLKLSKIALNKMHESYETLTNFVMKKNTVHVNYLRHLGFEFHDDYEIGGELFTHFSRYQPHV